MSASFAPYPDPEVEAIPTLSHFPAPPAQANKTPLSDLFTRSRYVTIWTMSSRSSIWILMPLSLVLLLLAGCTTEHDLGKGVTIETPSNFWYYTQWTLAGGLAILAFMALKASQGKFLELLFVAAIGTGAYFCVPGLDTPTDLLEAQRQTYSVSGRAATIRERIRDLKSKRDTRYAPLLKKHTTEFDSYKTKLKSNLKTAGLTSHEGLLKTGDEHLETRNTLRRAAILDVTIKWLSGKLKATEIAIKKLDQQAWELERRAELNEVATDAERKNIDKLILNAETIIAEDTPPQEKQDIAAAEKLLFETLVK